MSQAALPPAPALYSLYTAHRWPTPTRRVSTSCQPRCWRRHALIVAGRRQPSVPALVKPAGQSAALGEGRGGEAVARRRRRFCVGLVREVVGDCHRLVTPPPPPHPRPSEQPSRALLLDIGRTRANLPAAPVHTIIVSNRDGVRRVVGRQTARTSSRGDIRSQTVRAIIS